MQIIENRNWQGQLCNGLIPLNLCTPSSVRLDCHIIRPVYRRRAFMYTIWCIASPAFSGTSPSPSQSIAHFWCQFLHLVFASHGAVFLGIWCFDAAGTLLAVCYLSTTTGNKPFSENLPISLVDYTAWFLLSQFPCLVILCLVWMKKHEYGQVMMTISDWVYIYLITSWKHITSLLFTKCV